jgi:hypothetical protein
MKRIFLLEKSGDAILTTETTSFGSQAQFSPSVVQHKPWSDIESHFLGLGVTREALDLCHQALEKTGNAMLTINSL